MTCQPWPSRSKKLREYMKPWSSAPSASEPPAASAAALTVSTSSRDETLKQYSASVCGGIGDRQLRELRELLAAEQHDEGVLADQHAGGALVGHHRVEAESERSEERL